jgi:peroxiredoxin
MSGNEIEGGTTVHDTSVMELVAMPSGHGRRDGATTTKASVTSDTLAELFRDMGVGEHAKRQGDSAPDVTLLDNLGAPVRLRDQWTVRPLIVVFFKGGWCNYCSLQLHEWQTRSADLRRRGAKLLAVSPRTPDLATETTERNKLAFPVLSDSNLLAANAFGIAFTLPPELVEYFSELGTDIPVLNGNGLWALLCRRPSWSIRKASFGTPTWSPTTGGLRILQTRFLPPKGPLDRSNDKPPANVHKRVRYDRPIARNRIHDGTGVSRSNGPASSKVCAVRTALAFRCRRPAAPVGLHRAGQRAGCPDFIRQG